MILGCTHYPLIRPMLQRIFGRGVTLITSAEEIAREVAATLDRRGVGNEPGREGSYRFLCTGDERGFPRASAGRFLQLPLTEVERVDPARAGDRRVNAVPTAAQPTSCARSRSSPGFIDSAHGSVLFSIGQHAAGLHGHGRGVGAAVDARARHAAGSRPSTGCCRARHPSASRASPRGKPDGRTVEIQRLIGRSLRSVVDFEALGERTVWIDCDVLQADGGTRCAAICGGYVALHLALSGWSTPASCASCR